MYTYHRMHPPTRPPVDDLILSLADALPSHREGDRATTETGGTLSLSSMKGFLTVLFVLGIDCGTCKHIAEALSNLQDKYAAEAKFVGVCVQFGCRERLADFQSATKGRFPLGYCRTRDLSPALGIPKATWLFYPTMIFLDRNQRLRGLFIGDDEFFKDVIVNTSEALDSLLLEDEVPDDCLEVGV
jgi:thiol-disulfide isomerase/thioredoxin